MKPRTLEPGTALARVKTVMTKAAANESGLGALGGKRQYGGFG